MNTTPSTASQAPAVSIADDDEFIDLMHALSSVPSSIYAGSEFSKVINYIDAKIAQAREEALSEAMRICDMIGQDHRDQYKGRGKYAPNNPRRADSHADGCSDGAWECEGAIRALLFTQQTKSDESGLPG